MFGARIVSIFDLVPVRLDGPQAFRPHIAVLFDELGQEPPGREIASHVNLDKDLTRAAITGADANGGD